MLRATLFVLALAVMPLVAAAAPRPSYVDYPGFAKLAGDLTATRAAHLVSLGSFFAMADAGGALILDARSADAYARGHIAGAVNLPLTDFTAASLARTIGDPARPILIYCNNNFTNNVDPVPTKAVRLALNIQTFINLEGYGYPNVYELKEAVDFNDPRVRWVKDTPASPKGAHPA